jgi:hypothetical protein
MARLRAQASVRKKPRGGPVQIGPGLFDREEAR